MKTFSQFLMFAVLTTITLAGSAQTATVPATASYTVVKRGANSDILQRGSTGSSPTDEIIPDAHRVVRVATGLNYWDGNTWAPSDPTFQLSADGQYVYANKLQTKVRLSADLDSSNSVTLTTSDGIVLNATPVAVGLYDSESGKSLIIASITNCAGAIISSNQVLYENAFNGVSGNVIYTLKSGSFSQDIVWKQDIEPADYGFPTNTTRIEIFTAFNSPIPEQVARPLKVERNQALRRKMVSPDLIDHTLKFGLLKFGPGRAFAAASTDRLRGAPVAKSFENIEGQSYLVESIDYNDIEKDLRSLPRVALSSARSGKLGKNDRNRYVRIPTPHCSAKSTISFRQTKSMLAATVNTEGVVADYVALPATEPDPMVFQGDTTYFVDGQADFDNVILEGGAVIKYPNNADAYIEVDGALTCTNSIYLPTIFTAADDDSVGQSMNGVWAGYTGTIQQGGYANPALNVDGQAPQLNNLRIEDAVTGVYCGFTTINARDVQIINCGVGFNIDVEIGFFENVLIANSPIAFEGFYGSWFVENASIVNSDWLLDENPTNGVARMFLFNSVLANVTNLVQNNGENYVAGNNDGFYNSPTNGPAGISTTTWPFQIAGGGDYYLANNTFRGQGTTNGIDAVLVADLATKTTWPPLVYISTNISSLGTLTPQAPRDTSVDLDIGYHYDPLDWLFGACQLHTNLTVTAGTAVGWAGISGVDGKDGTNQPFGLLLSDGANLSFNGDPVTNCFVVNYVMAQEESTNWNHSGYMGAIIFNGTNSVPQLTVTFTIWTIDSGQYNFFRDDWDHGAASFHDCEFYNGDIATYEMANVTFTNCLFFRDAIGFWGYSGVSATSFNLQNCTFYNGFLGMDRSSGEWPSFWLIENTAFDGTAFQSSDNYNGSSYTQFDHNAYNASNLSWQTYTNFPANTNTLEIVGPTDVTVYGYGWQGSWLGDFYLPSGSPLINAGSTTADQLGLYEFTTQTSQVPETNSIVDIGYHYLATDQYGNPLDTYVPGAPNYLVDPGGNGVLNGLDRNGLPYSWEYSYFGEIGINPDATDPDGLETFQDYILGLSPVTDQSSQSGSRSNYSYTLADWLDSVSGARSGSITLDNEGNVQSVSQ